VITCGGLILGSLATWALLFIPKFIALVTRKDEIDNWVGYGGTSTALSGANSKFSSVAEPKSNRKPPSISYSHSSSKDRARTPKSDNTQQELPTVQPETTGSSSSDAGENGNH